MIPTFWALHLFGFSMNTLTMLALSLVVGMLVDDAIVEVENNVRHLRMGKPPLQAATDAAIEIGLAVIATSLTLCAVFIPVAFMDGIPGEFFKPFGFTATVAVLFSLLVARALTPMMASRLMKPYDRGGAPGPHQELVRAHRGGSTAAPVDHRRWLRRQSMVATIALAFTLPKGFAPNEDFGYRESEREPAAGLDHGRLPSWSAKKIQQRLSEVQGSGAYHRDPQPAQRQHLRHAGGARGAQIVAAADAAEDESPTCATFPACASRVVVVVAIPAAARCRVELTGDNSAILASSRC